MHFVVFVMSKLLNNFFCTSCPLIVGVEMRTADAGNRRNSPNTETNGELQSDLNHQGMTVYDVRESANTSGVLPVTVCFHVREFI